MPHFVPRNIILIWRYKLNSRGFELIFLISEVLAKQKIKLLTVASFRKWVF